MATPLKRLNAPLKTYSRRVNNNPDPPPSKKRSISDVPAIEEPSLPKKIKRDSIQNYFKALPTPLPTPEPSSDSVEPPPPSSPPSQTNDLPLQSQSLQRQRRRLKARPNLAPIIKMSDNGDECVFDFDDSNSPQKGKYLSRNSSSGRSTPVRNRSFFSMGKKRGTGAIESSIESSAEQAHPGVMVISGSRARTDPSTEVDSSPEDPLYMAGLRSRKATSAQTGRNIPGSMAIDGSSARPSPFIDLESANRSRNAISAQTSHNICGSMVIAGSSARPNPATDLEPANRSLEKYGDSHSGPITRIPVPHSRPIPIPEKAARVGSGTVQVMLDLGQNPYQKCNDCNMYYNTTDKGDRAAHDKVHREWKAGKAPKNAPAKVLIWEERRDEEKLFNKSYTFSRNMPTDIHRVHLVERTTATELRIDAEDALAKSHEDMGGLKVNRKELWSEIINPTDPSDVNKVPRYKIFVYYMNLEPVGVLLAERIAEASPFVRGTVDPAQKFKVYMSVDRIWVKNDQRHGGIGTKLIDLARDHFVPGFVLPKKNIAFSSPTSAGIKFAQKYTGWEGAVRGSFLVNL